MLRLFFAVPAAALITMGLFLFMQEMIKQDEPRLLPPKQIETIIITPQEVESPITPPPGPVDPVEPPPPPETFDDTTRNPPDPVPGPTPTLPPVTGKEPIVSPQPTGAIITIPPTFPERCKSGGASASVIVEFDINEQGDVVNPRVIASDDTCFNRSVLRAISGWKYHPKVVNGKPTVQRNIRKAFTFKLEG